ncbi:sugar ABC transporter ATP-binding protein [Thiospirochaeta perfilievii]|uniref:Sugar ABC transporter ATP-binding protein n=1 Tax=Thiospirochaeta perfilievii TaxID=252967 RepID=A0A5C1Q8R6_9SPIO|nr:sugar ABC transporter ATP-binding protein [Thiospirochaeta perfilievii]QEN03276.1 sugar ABC transporter ATP-binding protein [Thiospirochaeta perfilievii]
MSKKIILEMRGICKSFPGVKALDDVTFSVEEGEIHCLVGENGAGKSTLMKVLSGVYPHGNYSGDIVFNGEVQEFKHINDSEEAGIAIIYQELALIPELSVYENIFLGHEIHHNGVLNWNETIKQAGDVLKKVGLDINPETQIKELGVGKQQLVEIAKALSRDVKLLILDEPTAALNEDDCDNLLMLLKDLQKQGVTSIMITHKLKEVTAISDTVTVLRDGQTICTLDAKAGEISENILIKNMVGREIDNIYPPRSHKISDKVLLEVKNWTATDKNGRKVLDNMSLNVKEGEIIGLAGLMGAGRTEFARSIFGNPDKYELNGDLILKGAKLVAKHPKDAIEAGLAYVSEDRKGNGLILQQSVMENISISNLKELEKSLVIDTNAEIKIATEYKESLRIKTPSIEQLVNNLSGGNQQKVQLGKWLFVKPNVLILDEPTRGIDVGAKFEIYTLMNDLVEKGMSIIMISSELPEVLGMSDRIYVVSEGRITGEKPISEANQENIMQLATN